MNANLKKLQTALDSHIKDIRPIDLRASESAQKREDSLAKPVGSLGTLERLAVQMAGITGSVHNEIKNKHLLVFAADHGVVCEGVSSTPQSVTLIQAVNLTRKKTGASVIADHFDCRITVCDVGINAEVNNPDIINKKIAFGTKNIADGPAMTREQAIEAILCGTELARDAAKTADVIGVGEMGIGNTTAASAVLCVLSGKPVKCVTGRGGGLSNAALEHKKDIITRAVSVNNPDKSDPIDVLLKLGGFDIAAMCGAFIGCAAERTPVVIDGFPSVVSALLAYRICPAVREYLIPSHASTEAGYAVAMEILGLEPMLNLNMRLGEGSGCPLAFEILSAACAVINNMATFDEAGIDSGYIDELLKSTAGDKS